MEAVQVGRVFVRMSQVRCVPFLVGGVSAGRRVYTVYAFLLRLALRAPGGNSAQRAHLRSQAAGASPRGQIERQCLLGALHKGSAHTLRFGGPATHARARLLIPHTERAWRDVLAARTGVSERAALRAGAGEIGGAADHCTSLESLLGLPSADAVGAFGPIEALLVQAGRSWS